MTSPVEAMESARRATVDDLAEIERIGANHRGDIVGQRGASIFLQREAGRWPNHDRLRDLIAGQAGVVVVGCYDGVVFGYGVVVYEAIGDGTTIARLTDFVVEPEIRGSGIGEAMMNLVVDLAAQAGCVGIDSVALPGDRETKNFFESFGLKARLLTVHRQLGPSGDAGG